MGTGLVGTRVWEQDWWYNRMGTGLVVQEYGNRVRVRNILCLVYTVQPLDS